VGQALPGNASIAAEAKSVEVNGNPKKTGKP
jgi:hypothetical protein